MQDAGCGGEGQGIQLPTLPLLPPSRILHRVPGVEAAAPGAWGRVTGEHREPSAEPPEHKPTRSSPLYSFLRSAWERTTQPLRGEKPTKPVPSIFT